jgi:hypothetical protein
MRVNVPNRRTDEKDPKKAEFELKVREECAFLLSDRGVFYHPPGTASRQELRATPHVFVDFPYLAVVTPEDILDSNRLIDCTKIRIREVSREILEIIVRRDTDRRVVNFGETIDLGVVVKDSDGLTFADEICEWCGQPFSDDLLPRQKRKRRFCCTDCGRAFRSFNRQYAELRSEGNLSDNLQVLHDLGIPGIELARIIRGPCLHCGGAIGDNKSLRVKFCSDLCRYAHNNAKKEK